MKDDSTADYFGSLKEPSPTQKPNLWKQLFAYQSLGKRWPGAGRAALALGIPGFIALALGYESEMLLIAVGAYAVISGEGHPFRYRWKLLATIGALLVVGVTTGSFVGQAVWAQINAGGTIWWLGVSVLFSSLIAALLVFGANSLRMTPRVFSLSSW